MKVKSSGARPPFFEIARLRPIALHHIATCDPETSQVNCTYSPWPTRLPAPLYIFWCCGRGSQGPPATPAPRPASDPPATTGTAAPGGPARTSRRIMVATAPAVRVMVRVLRLKPRHAIDATHQLPQAAPKHHATTRSSTSTSARRPATGPVTLPSTMQLAPTTAATAARRRVKA